MDLPQRRLSWFLCFCIMCASPVHSKDIEAPTSDQHQSKHHGSDEKGSESFQKLQSDSEIDKREEAMRSDTGQPPGTTDTGQRPEAGGDGIKDVGYKERDEIEEEPAMVTETTPSLPVPPVMEEDVTTSDTDDSRVKEEQFMVEEKQHISGGQEEKLPEVKDNLQTSGDDSNSPKEEADTRLLDYHEDETQIEAPAFEQESVGEGEIGEGEEADKEDAREDENRLHKEEKISLEDLKEDEKIEGTETVEPGEEKGQEKQEGERKEEDVGKGDGDGGEEGKDEEGIIQESIPSFDEWKEKMLQKALEEQEKQYGDQNDSLPLGQRQFSVKDSKNYASSDCGAKILSANNEAQKASLILNFNRDEYMINPCSANIWFIVELCEPIQIKLLEIANLELFSSVPESFRVYTSDRFPAREWRLLGTLYAREERNLQSFLIDENLFTKFVKIELLTFFGKEHYCPLTVLRIFGTSMEEEIDAEEMGTAVLPPNPTPLAADSKENGILDSAKDAVISFVKNAAKAFTGENKNQDCEGEACDRVIPEEVDPTPVTECWNGELTTSIPDVEPEDLDSGALTCVNPCDDLESEDFIRMCAAAVCDVRDYWRIFPNCCVLVLAQTTLHLCCSISNCYLTSSSTREFSTVDIAEEKTSAEGFIEKSPLEVIPLETIPSDRSFIISNLENGKPIVFSSNLLLPSMTETASTLSSIPTPANTAAATRVVSMPGPPTETIPLTQLAKSVQENNVEITISPTPSFKGSEDLDKKINSPPSQVSSSEIPIDSYSSVIASTDLPSSETTLKTIPPSPISSVVAEGQGSGSPPPETPSSNSVDVSETAKKEEIKEKTETGAKKTDAVPTGETKSPDKDISQEYKLADEAAKGEATPAATEAKVDQTGSSTDTENTKTAEPSQPAKASEQSHSNGGNAHAGISNYGSQKDSVFMRLNNRIKSLELNLSLSSKYLEELSKSYKKQMEEMQKSFNKTVTSLTDKVLKYQEKHVKNTDDISRIDGQVEELTGIVSVLSLKTEDILQEVIERHLFLMICEVLLFCTLFMICVRRERNELRLARAMYEHHLEAPQRRNTLGASNPSQHSPRRGSLDRGHLRPGGSLDDLLIIGPTTPLREAIRANTGHHTKDKPKNKVVAHTRSNGSLTDLTLQNQATKKAKKKMESNSAAKISNPAGVLFAGSSGLTVESKSYSHDLGRHSPETIGTWNGSSSFKPKKITNGSKVIFGSKAKR